MAAPTSNRTEPAGTRPDVPAAGHCDFCGELLADRQIVQRPVGGVTRQYCCLGCAFIAEQLATVLPADRTAGGHAADAPQHGAGAGLTTALTAAASTRIDIGGMVCVACALLLEHRLRSAAGVRSAHVDFVAQRAQVVYDPGRTDRAALVRTILRTGYRVPRADDPRANQRAARIELLRVLLAWLAMMQVMMLAAPSYLAAPGQIAPGIEQMLRIAQCILSAPVVLFCAAPFWRAALSQLRVRRIGMDVPVALGLAAAATASVWATLARHGAVYFDSVTMFVALLLAVRWWQLRAMARATAQVDAAARQCRLYANRLRPNSTGAAFDSIPAEQLREGDRIVVPAGEAIPADARIAEGTTSVSQAWLTGESAALAKVEGEMVLAGSLNVGQPFVAVVVRAGDGTSLAVLQQLIVDAAGRRPPVARFAGRIASGFAAAVLALAGLTFALWMLIDPSRAVGAAICVLVVTCPCALSLAAPLAAAIAQARLARSGILLLRTAALESLAGVDTVAFDKTGTLTEHCPRLLRLDVLGKLGQVDCLAIAAAIEAHSHHPFALALNAAARAQNLVRLPAICIAESAGVGIEGIVAGQRFRLGRAGYALALTRDPVAGAAALATLRLDRRAAEGSQVVLAGVDGPLALFAFGETLRADAPELLRALALSGKRLLVLSGDQAPAVERLARHLRAAAGESLDFFADRSPEGKRAVLDALQRQGHRVAMVGDGMNDAPVIAQADASIALASGSRLAQVQADVIIPGTQLAHVHRVFQLAQRTHAVTRQNLLWALAYNLVMVPLAALGLLAPWIAAGGMALSAALVLANSLRLHGGGDQP
jgi:Cu2+-exporting ATPase